MKTRNPSTEEAPSKSPCVDSEICDWQYDSGDDSTGVSGCWICGICGNVDINRDPPSDPDADAYERNL